MWKYLISKARMDSIPFLEGLRIPFSVILATHAYDIRLICKTSSNYPNFPESRSNPFQPNPTWRPICHAAHRRLTPNAKTDTNCYLSLLVPSDLDETWKWVPRGTLIRNPHTFRSPRSMASSLSCLSTSLLSSRPIYRFRVTPQWLKAENMFAISHLPFRSQVELKNHLQNGDVFWSRRF